MNEKDTRKKRLLINLKIIFFKLVVTTCKYLIWILEKIRSYALDNLFIAKNEKEGLKR